MTNSSTQLVGLQLSVWPLGCTLPPVNLTYPLVFHLSPTTEAVPAEHAGVCHPACKTQSGQGERRRERHHLRAEHSLGRRHSTDVLQRTLPTMSSEDRIIEYPVLEGTHKDQSPTLGSTQDHPRSKPYALECYPRAPSTLALGPVAATLGSLFHARCPLLKNLSLTPNLTLPCDRNRQSRCRGLVFVLHQGSSCPPELWGLRSAECPATP